MGKKGENFFYDSNNEKCSSSELHFDGTNVLIGVISKPLFYNGLRMVTSSIYLLSITQNYEK